MRSRPVVESVALHKHFPVREKNVARRLVSRDRRWLRAVDGVDLRVDQGEILGLVGESGCGKSTLGRLLARLDTPTSGTVAFEGTDLGGLAGRELKAVRRRLQIVFQDPYRSLDPRATVQASVEEPLVRQRMGVKSERAETVARMLDRVELRPGRSFLERYPHELSGGQRQRVAIARAMILGPSFVVADEPVSMLDVSVRAGILNLMLRLKEEFGTSYLFVTHDLSVARYVSDRIAVMYLGRIVEQGPAETVIRNPQHPYARLLVSAVPGLGREHRVRGTGEMPSAAAIPSGCRFHTRCPIAVERCRVDDPVLRPIGPNRLVACHLAGETAAQEAGPPKGSAIAS